MVEKERAAYWGQIDTDYWVEVFPSEKEGKMEVHATVSVNKEKWRELNMGRTFSSKYVKGISMSTVPVPPEEIERRAESIKKGLNHTYDGVVERKEGYKTIYVFNIDMEHWTRRSEGVAEEVFKHMQKSEFTALPNENLTNRGRG